MARMRHLKRFNSTAEYEAALANDELSTPRVILITDEDNTTQEIIFKPLKETLIQLDDESLLGMVNSDGREFYLAI